MWHRKNGALHARYMACTIFPLITPVTDRLIYKNFDSLIAYVPVVEGMPIVPALGFLLGDVIVLMLLIWDWTQHRRRKAFTTVLVLLVLYHVSVLTFYAFGFWRSIVEGIMRLPLS